MRLMAMRTAWGGSGLVLLVTVALAACSSSGSPSASSAGTDQTAMAVCENALRAPVATAMGTTVGEIRALTIGPGARPAEHAFAGLPSSSPAAWCWTGGSGEYVAYGATPDGQKIMLAAIGGTGEAPSGPPVVP